MKHTYTIFLTGSDDSLRHLGSGLKIQQMVPGINKRKGHLRWPLVDLCFWPLKCVGVEDGIRGSDDLRGHHRSLVSTLAVDVFIK